MVETIAVGKTILVVEDNDDIRRSLSVFLKSLNYRVVEAADGEQAVEVARRELPNLIMMDLNLPRLDGFSAARRIRQLPELSEVPILANSAFGMRGIDFTLRAEDLGKGITEYMPKPIDFDQLRDHLRTLLTAD
jgi:two-component system, cell cycle response regulator DivK